MTYLALLAPLFGFALVLLLQTVETRLLGDATAPSGPAPTSAGPAHPKPTGVARGAS